MGLLFNLGLRINVFDPLVAPNEQGIIILITIIRMTILMIIIIVGIITLNRMTNLYINIVI
jgi:hypothetical protein